MGHVLYSSSALYVLLYVALSPHPTINGISSLQTNHLWVIQHAPLWLYAHPLRRPGHYTQRKFLYRKQI